MKPSTAIFLIFILQANASFFDDFTGAMSSVETAFGKLLNDVVTDVKTTVHCTILAMEKVLAISGAIKEPSMDECYDKSNPKNDNSYKLPLDGLQATPTRGSVKDMSEQISASISKVNKTLINIIDNVNHDRINHIKTVLQNETNRLTEISLLLRQELNKISQRVKTEFQQIDSDKLSLESIWNDLKILHDVERSDKNVTEVNEISQVLSTAIDMLHLNTTNEVHSDEDKMKVIIQELEHESPNNNDTFKSIDRELSKWKEEQTRIQNYSSHDWISKETPTSFKDVATKIFRDKDSNQEDIEALTRSENKIHNKNPYNEETQGGLKKTDTHTANLTDSNFFGVLSDEEQKKAIDEAENIIKENALLENILDNIFANGERDGVDVFNNPESFNFSNYK